METLPSLPITPIEFQKPWNCIWEEAGFWKSMGLICEMKNGRIGYYSHCFCWSVLPTENYQAVCCWSNHPSQINLSNCNKPIWALWHFNSIDFPNPAFPQFQFLIIPSDEAVIDFLTCEIGWVMVKFVKLMWLGWFD